MRRKRSSGLPACIGVGAGDAVGPRRVLSCCAGSSTRTTLGNAARRGGELGVAEEQPRAGVVEDVADLVGGKPVVDRQRHGAEVADGKRQLDEGRAVLHQQRHDVAGPDAARGQPARRRLDAAVELGVADGGARVVDRGPVRRALGVEADEARQADHATGLSSCSRAGEDRIVTPVQAMRVGARLPESGSARPPTPSAHGPTHWMRPRNSPTLRAKGARGVCGGPLRSAARVCTHDHQVRLPRLQLRARHAIARRSRGHADTTGNRLPRPRLVPPDRRSAPERASEPRSAVPHLPQEYQLVRSHAGDLAADRRPGSAFLYRDTQAVPRDDEIHERTRA